MEYHKGIIKGLGDEAKERKIFFWTSIDSALEVVADLTITKSTNEITFITDVELGEGTLTATADFTFDRSLYDVRYGSGSFFDDLGDKLNSDEVEVSVTLVANS